ncbi:hypothetical protein C923_03103 [Plasmodium falciparum UGT5.1]|uniref:Derlin n=1 Tax=Plasmodium falciparum UGT5.1 TaxID=1237627 RepID=W7JBR0_PLAFA|nr:hypothetical protein C923_03103 [Plasmodium falciparum UGT5.1]
MDISGPEVWYNNLPNVTKYVITLIFLVTLLITCNLLNVVYILLDWNLIYYKYHIWRIFLNFLYVGKFSLSWVFFMSLFAQFSSSLEKNGIFTSPGSYLYFITIQCTFLSLISILFYWPRGYPFLGNSLLFAIIYYWSRREAWSHVSIYFFTVKGYQLPFALIFLHLIMGQSLWVDIMGLLSGHVYYFFREILPREGGPNLLDKTPKIFDKIMLKLQEFRLNNGIRNNFSRYGYTNINNSRGTNNNNGTNRRVFIGRGATSALAHQFILHAKTLGIKTIYTDHSLYSFSDKGCIHVNKLLKYCINDVDHSICVSHTNRENLVLRTESNPYKTSVIGNALDTTKFVPCISKRPKFPRINIIVISRLTYRKGIDLIVKVIPLVCQKYPFIKFIIGGEGPKRLLLEEMREKYHLHNSVVLLGKVKQENVKNILQTGHIFLNTSLTEAFCIAIIEAASCGLLVISTDVGGISEVLPHDMMILAKPNHIELCKAVDKALKIVQKVDSNLFHERVNMKRKCCICMVSDFFYPNLGGIETHIFEFFFFRQNIEEVVSFPHFYDDENKNEK